MLEGGAETEQNFSVAANARLCFTPSMLVPHRKSRYRQTSNIMVERGGELIYFEMLAPGRVAHGECFEYTELKCELNIFVSGHLNARECYCLRPDDLSLKPLREIFPQACFASCYVISERLAETSPGIAAIREIHSADALVGVSRLRYLGWSIKVIARDGMALNRARISLLKILSNTLDFSIPFPRN